MTPIISPKLEELNNQLKNGNEKAIYTFLHEIKSNNTPLIEQSPADNQYKLITYIWLGDRKTEDVGSVCKSINTVVTDRYMVSNV